MIYNLQYLLQNTKNNIIKQNYDSLLMIENPIK